MEALRADRNQLPNKADGGQLQHRRLLWTVEHKAGQILDVDALHHDHDAACGFVVQAAQERVEYHWLTLLRVSSDNASVGLIGSSMMMRSPPRPVSVPCTETGAFILNQDRFCVPTLLLDDD